MYECFLYQHSCCVQYVCRVTVVCASCLTTGALVAAIGAVLISITLPDGGDTATVATLELAGLTFCLSTYGGGPTQRRYDYSSRSN